MTEQPLRIHDLVVDHRGRRPVRVLDGVNLTLPHGKTLGLVGESGSGKSTLCAAILGLLRPTSGRILFHGKDITFASARQRRRLCRRIQAVFQDPYGSLNPSRTIGATLAEPVRVGLRLDRRAAAAKVGLALASVGLPASAAAHYPAEFSGGQRQRIAIARALIPEPEVVICDEPTSALDLSVQAQILNLLLDLQHKHNLSYLFISHDQDVVTHMSHHIATLRAGRIVDQSPIEADNPRSAAPRLERGTVGVGRGADDVLEVIAEGGG